MSEEKAPVINIYVDTQVKGARGKGWYGYVLELDSPGKDIRTRDGFGEAEDTRNRIFLKAVKEALERIQKPMEIHIYMPCTYVVSMVKEGLLPFWRMNDWIKGDRQEVKNRDLWEPLLELLEEYGPEWHDGKHKYSDWLQSEFRKKETL